MTPDHFRTIALSLPGTVEASHMGHPDFRVGGKIFASLGYPDAGFAMIVLTPDEQALVCQAEPETFAPVTGAWGRKGATLVQLRHGTRTSVRRALEAAWRRRPPAQRSGTNAATRPRRKRDRVASRRRVH